MSDLPLITLIVTYYNEEAYLDDCLATVSQQDYPHLQILLMDDASTDASAQIALKYTTLDARMHLHRLESHSGIARLRNRALELAQGDYIAWIDGDDWIDKCHISALYATLQQAPKQPAIAFCPMERHRDDETHIDFRGRQANAHALINTTEALTKMMIGDKISAHLPNKLFPRTLFDGLRMPEGRVFEDFYLLPRLVARASSLIYTDQVCYHYRLHAHSIVHISSPKNDYDLLCACRDRIHFLRQHPSLLPPRIAEMLTIYPLKMMHRAYHRVAKMRSNEAHSYLAKMQEVGRDVGFKPYYGLSYSWQMLLFSIRKRYAEWWIWMNM